MDSRTIGNVKVSAMGLGGMPMSVEGRPDEDRSLRTIHQALDLGITLIDTADAYCLGAHEVGHNERLIAKGLATWWGDASEALVATKGGHTRDADEEDGDDWGLNGRPEYLKRACEASLKALGVEAIGLYQFHRPDPDVPYAESVGAFKDLQDEGKVRMVGLSNATIEQIEESRRIVDIASVQNEFSPRFRSSEDELEFCAREGIAFLPWSPLGGMGSAADLGSEHSAFAAIAEARGVSPQQVAIAWHLAKAEAVIPIPGSSRPETIADSAQAAELELDPEELRKLDAG
ncbi:MAG: aldo/keto reductase [Actinomycetota bacterium]